MKTVEEIVEIKQAAEKQLFTIKGVTGVDVGYKYKNHKRTKELAIRVHVAEKSKTVASEDLIPAEIDGVPTDVLQNKFEPQWLKTRVDDVTAFADVSSYSPLKGGISIGPDRVIGGYVYVGTLGAPVIDNTTNKTVLLSNFHVMCVDTHSHPGDIMDQPGRNDGGSIANRVATLTRGVMSSHVDAAISKLDIGKTTSCFIVDIGSIKGTASATLNAPVRKRGRTTLLTYGFVDAINGTLSVDYGPGLGVKTFTNQIGIRPDVSHNPKFSDHGDSGSMVVDANNKVIGLLFAGDPGGYTYINPINFVLAEMNVKLCTSKVLIKDGKIEKLEFKELKHEKIEVKEFKIEKLEIFDGKNLVIDQHRPIDPGEMFIQQENDAASQPALEQRLIALETAFGTMQAFITQNLRPDLSHGAYSNEE